MRALRSLCCAALVLSSFDVAADDGSVRTAALDRLRLDGAIEIRLDSRYGTPRFVRFAPRLSLAVASRADPPRMARDFLRAYGDAWGIDDPDATLRATQDRVDSLGFRHLSFEQIHQGVPVFASELRIHFDRSGLMSVVNGTILPDIDVDVRPTISAEVARQKATAAVSLEASRDPITRGSRMQTVLRAAERRLVVYRADLIRGFEGLDRLAWEIEVTNGFEIDDLVLVDAHRGDVVDRFPLAARDLYRRVFDGVNSYPDTIFWEEGMPLPSSPIDAVRVVPHVELTWEFFWNGFGYDSWDGQGGTMDSVINANSICPSSYWSGAYVGFCTGAVHHDVVGHEFGHGYTNSTHGLIYGWQSGALNEAYSYIWGETVDLLHISGTELPITRRPSGSCSIYSPPTLLVTVTSPEAIAGDLLGAVLVLGPMPDETGTTGEVVLVDDGVGNGVPPEESTSDACEGPFTNAAAIAGKIALIDLGTCSPVDKVRHAQEAGAIGAIVANYEEGGDDIVYYGARAPDVVIPSAFVGYRAGRTIRGGLDAEVRATVRLEPREEVRSARWLYSEDSPSRGGGWGDLWNPQCDRSPGKMSEYTCQTEDYGGTHANAFIVNHTYALLVDGGTYNGQATDGIGFTKAAHIYWRAQSVYQGPYTTFADHSDAIEQSCRDLVGIDLTDPLTGESSGLAIDSSDCTQVENAILATEMRDEPAHCGFGPLLDQDPPALCTSDGPTVFAADFEESLADWTLTEDWEGPTDKSGWYLASELPGDRAGSALHAADASHNCDEIDGVVAARSPVITLPDADGVRILFSFQNYVSTEPLWDGGNVKIRVNGGAWQLIEKGDFYYNGYNAELNGVTSMGNEPVFSGADDGRITGTWGESIVGLDRFAKPGDRIEIRFDFAVDQCIGYQGWFVDDVTITYCVTPERRRSVRRPD